jgi:hypothetical protein
MGARNEPTKADIDSQNRQKDSHLTRLKSAEEGSNEAIKKMDWCYKLHDEDIRNHLEPGSDCLTLPKFCRWLVRRDKNYSMI